MADRDYGEVLQAAAVLVSMKAGGTGAPEATGVDPSAMGGVGAPSQERDSPSDDHVPLANILTEEERGAMKWPPKRTMTAWLGHRITKANLEEALKERKIPQTFIEFFPVRKIMAECLYALDWGKLQPAGVERWLDGRRAERGLLLPVSEVIKRGKRAVTPQDDDLGSSRKKVNLGPLPSAVTPTTATQPHGAPLPGLGASTVNTIGMTTQGLTDMAQPAPSNQDIIRPAAVNQMTATNENTAHPGTASSSPPSLLHRLRESIRALNDDVDRLARAWDEEARKYEQTRQG